MVVENRSVLALETNEALQISPLSSSSSSSPSPSPPPSTLTGSVTPERERVEDMALPPRRELPTLEQKDTSSVTSTTTSSLEERELLDAGSSESDGAEDDDDGDSAFMIKPMSRLPVCPMDDLAVEQEKRRRRSMKNAKSQRRNCPDAESLPSPPRPLGARDLPRPRPADESQLNPDVAVIPAPRSAPQLQRDSMAIRQKYWKELGISMSRRDLERSTGRRRERREGLKVQLNDADSYRGESKSIFQMIRSWYDSNVSTSEDTDADDTEESSSSTAEQSMGGEQVINSVSSPRAKSVRFRSEAELFYIPLHRDYSKRQRDCMWHTRAGFISMVERNLEQVYDEMEREYEEQVLAEMKENAAMAEEEARQRKYEAQARAKAAALLASPGSSNSVAASPPNLSLSPLDTQIKVVPRARSPHDLRFKYLKHLGIKN